ncbi:hypothetical protein EVAR_50653_1 [Eumeta japonica]|uniref:Uncharacterized protein n=1 Tax=Eumeta variegata TaxID=151549 RepID=A0A4C1XI26_EUMVA|nr:hypothetical protein EVAR_50653_1 [Eumeta japonica]
MLTSRSLPFLTQREHFCLKYFVEEFESICRLPGFHAVSLFRQGRTDFAFNLITIGVDVWPDDGESVHHCWIQVLNTLELESGNVHKVRQFSEIHGYFELPVGKYVLQLFSAPYPIKVDMLLLSLCLKVATLRSPITSHVPSNFIYMGQIVEALQDTNKSSAEPLPASYKLFFLLFFSPLTQLSLSEV